VFARAAALAAPCPNLVIEVRGYADEHSDPVKNLDLAERRALEATGRLERHGARGGQLVRSASGDAHPSAAWRGVMLRAGAR
jgi:outer membrane protein OmpA-like peptidoglycan-associated protein